MAQHDYVIDNSTGANVRADINNALLAISSNNSGSSAPSTTYALQSFANTTDSMLQLRNAANNAFVNLRKFDGTLPLPDGTDSAPSLFFDDDTDTGIYSSAANTFNITVGGTERLELGGTTIFNETGADVDFRIEGDNEVNLFYLDAGNDRIGIGSSSPSARLSVLDDTAFTVYASAVPDSTNCMLQVSSNPSSEAANRHATIQFGVNGGTHNRVASISSVAESASNRKMALAFCTDSGSNRNERMRLNGDGQLGIGTTSPSQLLHLSNADPRICLTETTNNSNCFLDYSSGGVLEVSVDDNDVDSSSKFQVRIDGATASLTLDSTGLGIGTTSPTSLLNLSAANPLLRLTGTNAGNVDIQTDSADFLLNCDSSNAKSNSAIAFRVDNSEKCRINSDGKLLLGQTSDTDGALCMNGVLAFSAGGNGTASTSNARPNISRGADGQLLLAGGKDSGSSIRFDVAASASTNAAEVARFDNGGNLLIGTTTLSLGTSSFGFVVFSGGAFNNFSNVNGSSSVLRAGGNQGEAKVMGDGDLQNTNNSYGQISDETLKQDIVDAASQWNDIKNLKVRKFRFKDNPTGVLQIGVIAQEIETVSAGLVQEDDKGLKSVKYSVLYMKAVKCLQEAIAKIEVLETKVAALEAA